MREARAPGNAAATPGGRDSVSILVWGFRPKKHYRPECNEDISRPMLSDVASILRFHIIMVAMAACVVFGWLMTGEFPVAIALLGGVDWLLINLLNKITDVEEDLTNQIRGTERVASNKRLFSVAFGVIFVGSFVVSSLVWPELTLFRIVVQLIGLGYSIPMVPTPKGLRRFKEIYFLKNFMSSVLFVLTCFVYPYVAAGYVNILPGGFTAIVALVLFFVPFELTYEILYDMRDLEGDTQEGIPTYPVVHGMERSRQIIDALLVFSVVVLAVAVLTGTLGVRESLFAAAPAIQFFFYRPRLARGLTSHDCIWLTHLGTGLLVFFVLGTQIWLAVGLPENIYM